MWEHSGVRKTSTAERSGGATLELRSGQLTWTGWSCFWEPSPHPPSSRPLSTRTFLGLSLMQKLLGKVGSQLGF